MIKPNSSSSKMSSLQNIDNYENIFEFPFNVLDVRDGSVRKLSIVSISTHGSSTSDTISVRSVKNSSKEKSSNTQINNSIVIENSNVNMNNVNMINSNEDRTIEIECDSMLGESGQIVEDFLIGNVMPNEEHSDRRVWPTLNPKDRSHLLELSLNCLFARNNHDVIQSVRSQCGVCSDVYYYEVYLFSGGSMRIGWATKQTDLNGSAIGEDRYSIALDGSSDRHRIFHQRTNLSVNPSSSSFFKPKTRWFENDVVGCLIDFNRKKFKFYVNGKLVKYNDRKVHFEDDQSYYAAISLAGGQMCYFNFGQAPFKYTQVDVVEFKTICQNFGNYQLLELYFPSGTFKEVLVNSHVDSFFDDPKQKDMNKMANQIEQNILDSTVMVLNKFKLSKKMRIIQAIIEVGVRRFQDNRFDVHASWIAQLITQSTSENLEFPHHVFQLLYPYFKLHLTNDTATKHRNVCIILASLVSVISDFKARVNLYELVLTYLTEIISKWDQLSDEILFVAVLVAIGNMELNEEERINLKSNEKLRNALKSMSNPDLNDIAILARLSTVRQLVLLSQLTLEHLFNSNQTNLHSRPFSNETLDPSNSSAHIKLSPDLLSARSDHSWQSVRSMTSISPRRYYDMVVYYEVTLVTCGIMRIGWASENVPMCSGIVGDDQYSIGFDGHNQCIWHRGRQYPISNVPKWTVGDVVGCLMAPRQKRFAFYLNKEPIHLPFFSLSPYFSSAIHYYAAASLFAFQQCQFNFSVAKLPPRRLSFRVIDSVRNSINRGSRYIVMNSGNVVNSLNNVAGRIEAGNINIAHIPDVDNSTSVNNEDITIQLQSTSKINDNPKKERRRSV